MGNCPLVGPFAAKNFRVEFNPLSDCARVAVRAARLPISCTNVAGEALVFRLFIGTSTFDIALVLLILQVGSITVL